MKSLRLSPESAIEIYHPQQTEETLYRKFLPHNSGEDSGEEQSDSYSDDQFRMYEFKVRMCARSRSHDWTDCPFAHPSEKARRRCPRRNKYSGEMCPDFRRGSCSRGELCKFAHGVFEFWLHPSRYRTEACKDGVNCHRKICFFAHTARQLRLLPPVEPAVSLTKHHSSGHCCSYCRCHSSTHYTSSPKSTLNVDIDSLSPPTSPPFSPVESGFSPVSRFTGAPNSFSSYQDSMNELIRALALHELMASMDAMNVNRIKASNTNSLFVQDCFNGHDDLSGLNRHFTRGQKLYEDNKVIAESSLSGPDLGRVNDLLT